MKREQEEFLITRGLNSGSKNTTVFCNKKKIGKKKNC